MNDGDWPTQPNVQWPGQWTAQGAEQGDQGQSQGGSGHNVSPGGFPGPAGDWLNQAPPQWAPPQWAPPTDHPTYPQLAGPGIAGPGPWVSPPALDAEPSRSRINLAGATPWLVGGLIVAVLLTGRSSPATPVAAEAPPPPTTATSPADASPAVAPAASCAQPLP